MELDKSTQELKRVLQDVASDLKWSIVELKGIAERLKDAKSHNDEAAISRMIKTFQDDEKNLEGCAKKLQEMNLSNPK